MTQNCQTPSRQSFQRIAAAVVMTGAVYCTSVEAGRGIQPLSQAERERAQALVEAEIASQGLAELGARTTHLRTTVMDPGKAQRSHERVARVMYYNYEADKLLVGKVDLRRDVVRRIRAVQDKQPALTATEIETAKSIALNNPKVLKKLRNEYEAVTGQTSIDFDDIVVHVRGFGGDLAIKRLNSESRKCMRHRCARVTFVTDESTMFRFVPIVNLSKGKVIQNIPFGPPNHVAREIRRRAAANRTRVREGQERRRQLRRDRAAAGGQ